MIRPLLLSISLTCSCPALNVTLTWDPYPWQTEGVTSLYLWERIGAEAGRLIAILPPETIEHTADFPPGSHDVYLVAHHDEQVFSPPSNVVTFNVVTRWLERSNDLGTWTRVAIFDEVESPRYFYRVVDDAPVVIPAAGGPE